MTEIVTGSVVVVSPPNVEPPVIVVYPPLVESAAVDILTNTGNRTPIDSTPDSITTYPGGVAQKHIIRRDLGNLGAIEGTSDANIPANDAALAAAIASGKVHTLQPGSLYKFGVGIIMPSGFGLEVPSGGWTTLLMATGAGYFDTDKNYPSVDGPGFRQFTDVRRTLLQCTDGAERFVLDGIEVQLEANPNPRCAIAAHFFNAQHMQVPRLRTRDFKEQVGGITKLRSCHGGIFHHWAHDLNVDSTSLTYMAPSGLDIDDSVGFGNPVTTGMDIACTVENFHLSTTARAHYFEQSDCISGGSFPNQHGGNKILARAIGPVGPGEVLDFSGSGNDLTVIWDDCRIYGVKMIFGGDDNKLRFKGSGTGLSALIMQASNVANRPAARGNDIEGECIDVGRNFAESFGAGGYTMQAGIYLQNDLTASDKMERNDIRARVESYMSGATAVMPVAVTCGLIGSNRIEIESSKFGVAFAQVYTDANSKFPDIRRRGKGRTMIRAHYGTAGSVSVAHNARIPFSVEDQDPTEEFTPHATTPFATLDKIGAYLVSGQVRFGSVGAGVAVDIMASHESVLTVMAEKTNWSTGATGFRLQFSYVLQNHAVGNGLLITLATSDASSVTVFGSAAAPYETYLNIQYLGDYYG